MKLHSLNLIGHQIKKNIKHLKNRKMFSSSDYSIRDILKDVSNGRITVEYAFKTIDSIKNSNISSKDHEYSVKIGNFANLDLSREVKNYKFIKVKNHSANYLENF